MDGLKDGAKEERASEQEMLLQQQQWHLQLAGDPDPTPVSPVSRRGYLFRQKLVVFFFGNFSLTVPV